LKYKDIQLETNEDKFDVILLYLNKYFHNKAIITKYCN